MIKRRSILFASLMLALLFGLQVTSAPNKSPTYDEQGFIARGYAWVKLGDLHIRIGTPILLNALNALPLLGLPDVRLPVDSPSWSGTNFHPIGEGFMWRVNDNADQILFLARVPTMLLALLLAAFVYRWAADLYGPWGGLLALALCALDPNVIAHGRLAATDLGFTTFFFVSLYWAWRLLRRPSWGRALAAGVALGLAQGTKFSALLLGPILALLFGARLLTPAPFALRRGAPPAGTPGGWLLRLRGLAAAGAIVVAAAYLTLWAVYGFQIGPVPGLPPVPVLAPAHFDQFLDLSGRLTGEEGRQATSFLMGELYEGGRWTYFWVVLALKTPIPTLILALGAGILSLVDRVRRRRGPAGGERALLWCVWLPPAVFMAFSMASNLNLGYRYILPILPFLLVLSGRMGAWIGEQLGVLRGQRRALLLAAAAAVIGWSAWSGLAIYPHYLAFFNEWAGGPDNGWRCLVDSNLDWGQDLKGLARWAEEQGVTGIKLAYYGEAYPTYYGLDFEPLTGWPDRWGRPDRRSYYPQDPAPGLYAISANLLQGRNLVDPDTYAWFRGREPVAKIGYSIFLYEVAPRGEGQAVLALSGLRLSDLAPADYARLGTNQVRVMWFDGERAVVAPTDPGRALWAFDPAALGMPLSEACEGTQTLSGQEIVLCPAPAPGPLAAQAQALAPNAPAWRIAAIRFTEGDPADHGERLAYPIDFGGRIEMLGYELTPALQETSLSAGETLTLRTFWRVRRSGQDPLKLFAHLLDSESVLLAGEDRLDAWYGAWQPGDVLLQTQRLAVGPDVPPGVLQVEIGWYNPETMQRLPVLRDGASVADRLLLHPARIR